CVDRARRDQPTRTRSVSSPRRRRRISLSHVGRQPAFCMASYPFVHHASCPLAPSQEAAAALATPMNSTPPSNRSSEAKGTDANRNAPAPEDTSAAQDGWLSRPERGALWGIHFVFRLATFFGRKPARLFVRFIAL